MRRTGSSGGDVAEFTGNIETRHKTVKTVATTTSIAEDEKEGE